MTYLHITCRKTQLKIPEPTKASSVSLQRFKPHLLLLPRARSFCEAQWLPPQILCHLSFPKCFLNKDRFYFTFSLLKQKHDSSFYVVRHPRFFCPNIFGDCKVRSKPFGTSQLASQLKKIKKQQPQASHLYPFADLTLRFQCQDLCNYIPGCLLTAEHLLVCSVSGEGAPSMLLEGSAYLPLGLISPFCYNLFLKSDLPQ